MIRKLLGIVSLSVVLGGCWGEPETGPVDIKYGREAGEYCGMIISDPRFAAEIRKGKGEEILKFDDIGDAIHWLKDAPWKETKETEFWVRDMDTGKKWLDARSVQYLSGQHSPMEYGFGAIEAARDGSMTFGEMRKSVIARGSTSRCETPSRTHTSEPHGHSDAPAKE